MLRSYTVPKNQGSLYPLFKLYLRRTGKSNPALEKLLGDGVCFGSAVCRAAMRISGKLHWWNSAISAIASWDGQIESLNQPHLLPGSSQVVLLDNIFERVLHYLAFNHADYYLYPEIRPSHYNFLLPDGFFEMLDASGKLLKVKKHYKIGGYFSCDDLVNILNDLATQKLIQNNICLVHGYSPAHTRELGYANGLWSLSCANNPNGDANYYYNVYTLSEEIIKIHKSIIIELACVNEEKGEPFSYYYNVLIKTRAKELLQEDAVIHLSAMAPDVFVMMMKTLKPQEYQLINCEQVSHKGRYPIHYAMYHLESEITKILCEARANLNVIDSRGHTPLMAAVQGNNIHAIGVLNSFDADPNVLSSQEIGMTALMIAAAKGNENVIKELLNNKNMNVHLHAPAPVSRLIHQELQPAFENYCKKYPGNIPYFTALHYAVFANQEEAIPILLQAMGNIKVETLNDLWELSSLLGFKNIRDIIDHELKLKLNLTNVVKRNAESDNNERPLKKAKHSHHVLFKPNERDAEVHAAVESASFTK